VSQTFLIFMHGAIAALARLQDLRMYSTERCSISKAYTTRRRWFCTQRFSMFTMASPSAVSMKFWRQNVSLQHFANLTA